MALTTLRDVNRTARIIRQVTMSKFKCPPFFAWQELYFFLPSSSKFVRHKLDQNGNLITNSFPLSHFSVLTTHIIQLHEILRFSKISTESTKTPQAVCLMLITFLQQVICHIKFYRPQFGFKNTSTPSTSINRKSHVPWYKNSHKNNFRLKSAEK